MSIVIGLLCLTIKSSTAFAPISSISANANANANTNTAAPRSATHLNAALAEGLTKTVTQQGTGKPLRLGDIATVSYNCYIPSTPTDADADAQPVIISKSSKQKVVVGDGVMIQGWEVALSSMVVGERSIVRVEDAVKYGYGATGVPPIVPANAVIEMDIEVLDSELQTSLGYAAAGVGSPDVGGVGSISGMTGSGELGALDPMKPRTPDAIAAAYKARQEQMAINPIEEKEGLEGWIEKAKNFYFFGFFEGETGEKAPWILRPSITFPIAFAIVGAAFWVSFAGGAISERGAQIKDELDDVVLSYNIVKDALVIAFASQSGVEM